MLQLIVRWVMLVHKRKVGIFATNKERKGGGVVTLKWVVGTRCTELEGEGGTSG